MATCLLSPHPPGTRCLLPCGSRVLPGPRRQSAGRRQGLAASRAVCLLVVDGGVYQDTYQALGRGTMRDTEHCKWHPGATQQGAQHGHDSGTNKQARAAAGDGIKICTAGGCGRAGLGGAGRPSLKASSALPSLRSHRLKATPAPIEISRRSRIQLSQNFPSSRVHSFSLEGVAVPGSDVYLPPRQHIYYEDDTPNNNGTERVACVVGVQGGGDETAG